jgi:hypothetical protein
MVADTERLRETDPKARIFISYSRKDMALDADHPENGVLIPRRTRTPETGNKRGRRWMTR